jgi:hypothetical protein
MLHAQEAYKMIENFATAAFIAAANGGSPPTIRNPEGATPAS